MLFGLMVPAADTMTDWITATAACVMAGASIAPYKKLAIGMSNSVSDTARTWTLAARVPERVA
jgi:hypothetical protein